MSYTNGLDKPSEYFNTKLYSGNSSTQSITGVGFQPDLVWIKSRTGAVDHDWVDSVRGVNKAIASNTTSTEGSFGTNYTIDSFDSDGFTLHNALYNNASGSNYASWSWLASGTGVSNTQGSIASTVSANTTSGFSIVSYTGTGATATVGHGLGVAPSMIIFKNRDAVQNWVTYHSSLGGTKAVFLDNTDAQATSSSYFNNTSPTSSLFYIGASGDSNGNGHNMIAYCFAEKKGFSKFGSYTGNGSTDGTFVYTGFKPAFLIIKRSSSTGNWELFDNKRDIDNTVGHFLEANTTGAESDLSASHTPLDFLSNGFKLRNSSLTGNTNINLSGSTYIFMAFAESPFTTSTGIPTTAR
jgi:hypothetical protein